MFSFSFNVFKLCTNKENLLHYFDIDFKLNRTKRDSSGCISMFCRYELLYYIDMMNMKTYSTLIIFMFTTTLISFLNTGLCHW